MQNTIIWCHNTTSWYYIIDIVGANMHDYVRKNKIRDLCDLTCLHKVEISAPIIANICDQPGSNPNYS